MAAWWHEQPGSKPHRQSSSSSIEVFAASRTPPPRNFNSQSYLGNYKPALGQKGSLDWGYIITVLALIFIIVILSRILENLIAKLSRRDAEAIQDANNDEGTSRNWASSSIQTSTSSSLQKRGLDSLFPSNLSIPNKGSSESEPETRTAKGETTIVENIQAYLAQNGGAHERRLGMSETYARRRRREQEGYLVGF